MASLQEIKTRLGSITTTRKITKAMQLVATAKLQKAKNNLNSIQEYYSSVYELFQELLENAKDIDSLFPKNAKESSLNIVITSDIGLAGGYNSNILKMVKEKNKPNDKYIVIGNKGIASLKSLSINPILEFPNTGDEPNYMVATEISKVVMANFLAGEFNKINLYHTKFINSVTFNATETHLLPIDKSEASIKKQKNSLLEFEPDASKVLKDALPLYISALIFGSIVESKVSEMSSRRTAMENATDNAEELIQNLNLEYNRARQASITQQIVEIVSGSEE